jgi:hypothetical protein
VPSTEHSRVGVSIDVYSVECTDGSADMHRPRLEAQQNETEDVDKLRGTDGGERTFKFTGVRRAELEHLKPPVSRIMERNDPNARAGLMPGKTQGSTLRKKVGNGWWKGLVPIKEDTRF